MKKIIVIFLCIAVIIGIGIGVLKKTKETRFGVEDILPQDVAVYVQLQDVEKNFQELMSMPIWQAMSKIDFGGLLKRNSVSKQQDILLSLIKNQLSDIVNNPVAKRLFGNEVAVAIYPLDMDLGLIAHDLKTFNPKVIEKLLSGLFLVTRVDADVQFAEFASRFFNQFGSNISQGQVEYKGETIRTITVSNIGIKFGIVRLKDLLVVGIGEKAARVSVDVYKQDTPSLAKDSQFSKNQNKFLEPSSMVSYVNLAKLMEALKAQGSKLVSFGGKATEGANLQDQWEKALARMAGFKAFAFSSQLTPIVRADGRLVFDRKALDSEYAPIYTCPSTENKTIGFTPQEVLGYYWSNCFKLDYYWKQVTKEIAQAGASVSRIGEFEEKIGLSVEKDILPAFGDEVGGYIQDIQVGGLFPTPKFLFFAEVGDKSKAEKLLQKLEEQPLMMLQEESYGGAVIKYFALPLGQDLQPGYAFLGDYLLVSTSRNLIKKSVDASTNAKLSLVSDPDFKEINFGLTDKNRSIQFSKIGQMVEKVKGIVGWSSRWVAARDQKTEAFKAGSNMPLKEVEASIILKEGELEEIRDRLIVVEDDVWNLETKGEDVSVQQAELEDLRAQLDMKKSEIIVENERKEGLSEIVQGLDKKSLDPESRQFYLEEILYPALDSLKFIKSFGLRNTLNGDAFESSVLFKMRN